MILVYPTLYDLLYFVEQVIEAQTTYLVIIWEKSDLLFFLSLVLCVCP